ncbi:MAG: DUF2071 domain-containing protein [Pirellulales bacterium]
MPTTSPPEVPTQPLEPKLLTPAAYNELVAVNFQINPALLDPYLPRGLELDFYGGETYVSLTCMVMRKIGILGLPISRGFVELSLRFFVRHPDDPLNRKGTCFIKNYVSSPTATWFLNSRFDRDYIKMKMKHKNSGFGSRVTIPEVQYQWKVDDHWNNLRVKARSQIKNTGPDTKVGFILDHASQYLASGKKTLEYKVTRPTWQIWDAAQANFTCDVERLFGKPFVKPLARRPASVFVTEGSDINIYRPVEIT